MKLLDKLKALKPSQKVRGISYRVLFAVGGVLVAEGVISEGELQLFDLVATVLLGVASANTPVRKPAE